MTFADVNVWSRSLKDKQKT